MTELNSFSPQLDAASPVGWVNGANPCGSVNSQKPKKTTTTASTPLFMVRSVLSCWGSGTGTGLVLPELRLGLCTARRGGPDSAVLDPARGVVPEDPAGLLVLGILGRHAHRR